MVQSEGNRVIFTNRFSTKIDDDEGLVGARLNKKRQQLYFCHYCGTLHTAQGHCAAPVCKRPGPLVPVWIVQLNEHGRMQICPSLWTA